MWEEDWVGYEVREHWVGYEVMRGHWVGFEVRGIGCGMRREALSVV